MRWDRMIKKIILAFILLLSVIYLVRGGKKMEISKLEKMRKLEKGTSYNKVVSIFGEPDEDLGSGLLIVGYVFEDSKLVLHFFTGDTLQGLWEIKNNGEKIIYIPLKLDK